MTTTDVRFAFGENWSSFADQISEDHIAHAETCLRRLFPNGELQGRHFFDIGCGSGLSMLAALRLGASEVSGVDIDANSTATTQRVLQRYAGDRHWTVEQRSVFDLAPDRQFSIVYSWGVLHHTGDMYRAIRHAAAAVAPGGLLAIAIYRKTAFCKPWTTAKRVYCQIPRPGQSLARGLYKTAFSAGLIASGRNPIRYARTYMSKRGMSWSHDVHDWLGGYPYESALPAEIIEFGKSLSLSPVRAHEREAPLYGIFGSHCDEYVFAAL